MPRSSKSSRSRNNTRSTFSRIIQPLIVITLVALGIVASVLLINQNQDLRGDASTASGLKFTQQFAADWHHINRQEVYDYAPSGFIESDGTWKVWTCGGKTTAAAQANQPRRHLAGDWIFYTRIDKQGHHGTVEVLSPSSTLASMDSRYACAPTVTRFDHEYVRSRVGGSDLYMMHYECSPNVNSPVQGFTEICVAYSADGLSWQKYNKQLWDSQHKFDSAATAVASPVIIAQAARDNCGYRFENGSHRLTSNCDDYGVGHPTTVLFDTNAAAPGGEEVWMWYYDSGRNGANTVYLTKSWDGFNFSQPIKTNLTRPVDVKYISSPDLRSKYFVATQVMFGNNLYSWSTDGITWSRPSDQYLDTPYLLGTGSAISSECASPSQPAILGNSKGVVTTSFVNILSAEGFYGVSDQTRPGQRCHSAKEDLARGSTWGIRVVQGRFSDGNSIFAR